MSVEDVLLELAGSVTPQNRGTQPQKEIPDLAGEERIIFDTLEFQPIHLDAICSKCELDPSTALVHLLSLEFKGLVRQMAGKQFARN